MFSFMDNDVGVTATSWRARRVRCVFAFIGTLIITAFPVCARATVFAPAFTGPQLDNGLVVSGSEGTGFKVGGGTLTLSQASGGSGESLISVSTTAPITGDFVATVTASGVGLGRADLGIHLGFPDFSNSLADVFLNDNSNTLNGNIFQPLFNGVFVPKATETVTLTISRQGDTVTDLYDIGAGPVVLNAGTDPALAADAKINLFLLNAVGDSSAHQGAFVNVKIVTGADAAAILAEPGSGLLVTTFALLLCSCLRRSSRHG